MVLALVTFAASTSVEAEHDSSRVAIFSGGLIVADPISNEDLLGAGPPATGVTFDISDLELDGKSEAVLAGNLTATIITCNPCGFTSVAIGTDRDDDGVAGNVDVFDDDLFHGHGTSSAFDDQFTMGNISGPFKIGNSIGIPFCFAHDTEIIGGHDWDDLVVSIMTRANSPSAGTIQLTLGDVQKIGNSLSSCRTSSGGSGGPPMVH